MEKDRDTKGFAVDGKVVEILERDGQRFARVVIESGTVVELPASIDLNLGDRVLVDSGLVIHEVSGRADTPGPAAPAAPRSWRDYEHVLRMAVVFAVAIAGFLVWRAWMVPKDFGVYGHYRAGAPAEIAALPVVYAGQGLCVSCHTDVRDLRQTGRHAGVACEACHGPLGPHARGETDVAPIRPSTRGVCLTCHTARLGMPAAFPKIVVKEHSDAGPCTDCHKAHAPGV
jgi:hypothetical protein